MNESMIKICGISKKYKLGQIGGTTFKEELQRLKAKRLHNNDPDEKVGLNNLEFNKEFMALNNVSFEVNKGERVGIIGHNGAGKSTLLKLISKITAPTEGDIWLNGRIASMLEVGTGFHGELSGRENIYLNGAILGMKKKEIDQKIDDIIDFSECRQFIDTPVKRYSSGMYVKLAFSVAAYLDAEIMIMDEVLAVGDMAFQKKCLDKMNQVSNEEKRTILYVSHNMNTIRQLCNRCIVLDSGQIVFDGDVENAINIYLNDKNESEIEKDLLSVKRLDYLKKKDIRFVYASYYNKNNNIFKKNELINLELVWVYNENVSNAGLRIVIYDAQGNHIAASFIYDFCSGAKENKMKAKLEMDISNMSPGAYQSYYVLFYINEFGATEDIDQVRGLDFIIDDSNIVGKLSWRTEAWGHFELPMPNILEMRQV